MLASLVAERGATLRGFLCCRAQVLRCEAFNSCRYTGSISYGSRARARELGPGLVAPKRVDLPRSGTRPMSPSSAGGFLSTVPPGKSNSRFFIRKTVKVAQLCQTLCDPMEFSRLDYWSGQLVPSPGDLPKLGLEPRSPALQADSLPGKSSFIKR